MTSEQIPKAVAEPLTGKIGLKPKGDRVLIDPMPEAEFTKAGLLIPENARERPQMGTVVGRGEEVSDDQVKLGAQVLFGRYSGAEIDWRDHKYLLLRYADIAAEIIEP